MADIQANVLRTFLVDEAALVRVAVVNGVVMLSGKVERWSSADIAERLSRQVAGVVEVISTLTCGLDGRRPRAG